MLHRIKIKQCYLIHILEGIKNFEVRKNDRDYQVGDKIRFLPIEDENYDVYLTEKNIPEYKIIYVHEGYGINATYVVLGIKAI